MTSPLEVNWTREQSLYTDHQHQGSLSNCQLIMIRTRHSIYHIMHSLYTLTNVHLKAARTLSPTPPLIPGGSCIVIHTIFIFLDLSLMTQPGDKLVADGKIRWLILFLACWIMFGNYYAFDNPSALNRSLQGIIAPMKEKSLFQYRFNVLYSVYSIPNVALPFFVGKWLDHFGCRVILVFLSLIVATGQFIVAFGISRESFPMVVLGRILFGLGGESLAVAQSRLVTKWFKGKELALAIGLNLSVARIGTVANNIISPIVAEEYSVADAFWIGFASCVLSFICTLATIILDRWHDGIESHVKDDGFLDAGRSRRSTLFIRPLSRTNFEKTFWILVAICFLFYV